jgi:VWFA-related protein
MNLRPFLVPILAVVAAFSGFHNSFARAQETQGPITPKPGATIQKPPEGVIRVRVALVNAPVTVRDSKKELVLDLQKENFHVFDNGIEQPIDTFGLSSDPLSVVLLFETSSRIAPLLPAVQKSAIVFTQTVVGPSGKAAVLSYDEGVQNLLPLTDDRDKIEKTITTLKAGNSGTRLYDALFAAVNLLRNEPADRRRVVIVVGEASDRGSENRLGRILRRAQIENVVIYGVGLSTMSAGARSPERQAAPAPATPPGTFGKPPMPGTAQTPTSEQQYAGNIDLLNLAEWTVRNAEAVVKDRPLEVATAATGGLFQSAVLDSTIEKAVDSIGGELNSQYMVSYHPTKTDDPGYHKIRMTVDRAGVKVRTRPGYYLEAN